MKLCKLTAFDAETEREAARLKNLNISELPFAEQKVQGARICRQGDLLVANSPRRYKLYAEGRDLIVFLEGEGHFKWARGELDFRAGETFCAEQTGEYEINGQCVFAMLRKNLAQGG